jgi:malonate transporter and related proteins
LVRQVVLNPLVLSTILGIAWSMSGFPVPRPVDAFLKIFGDALTGCALFALGLGLSLGDIKTNLRPSLAIAVVKLGVMPALVWGLSRLLGLGDFYTTAAVVCAGVPTAKTAYILSKESHCEEALVASTVSLTTVLSTITLVFWLYVLG